MESSFETDLRNSHEEGKLYMVDSLNNLNEQRLCVVRSQHQRMYATERLSTTCQDATVM